MEPFISQLLKTHQDRKRFPSNEALDSWLQQILSFLFPEFHARENCSKESLLDAWFLGQKDLEKLVRFENEEGAAQAVTAFYRSLPRIYEKLLLDAQAIERGDPAATGLSEVIRTYPGFYAIAVYRMAHGIFSLGYPKIARLLTELAHGKTGIDIHPGALIGDRFFIDHGTGIVIGETTVIGNDVKLYQGVTLGALSVKKELANIKRHPTIEAGVVIYAGATILGGETVVGKSSVIGGNVWLTQSVPAGSLVQHNPSITIQQKETCPIY